MDPQVLLTIITLVLGGGGIIMQFVKGWTDRKGVRVADDVTIRNQLLLRVEALELERNTDRKEWAAREIALRQEIDSWQLRYYESEREKWSFKWRVEALEAAVKRAGLDV